VHYSVQNGFAAILDVPGERIQSVGESIADGAFVGRSHTHRVQAVVGTEEIGHNRKRVHKRIHGKDFRLKLNAVHVLLRLLDPTQTMRNMKRSRFQCDKLRLFRYICSYISIPSDS